MSDPELDDLKREFLAEAQDKVDEMESTLGRERTLQSLDRLVYLAHQLKGSGGSYGFQRISTDAAELEKAIERAAKGADGLDDTIRRHVVNLRTEIERGKQELKT